MTKSEEFSWEHFACAALQGMLADTNLIDKDDWEICEAAGKFADKMMIEMKARIKEEKENAANKR